MTNIPELRRLHGAATQGEWRLYYAGSRTSSAIVEVQCDEKTPVVSWRGFDDSCRKNAGHKSNAAAIVALHNAAPALFDAADRLARVEAVLASEEAVERVARGVKARRFTRIGRHSTIAHMDAPTENDLDDARAAIAALAGLVGEG